MKEQYGIQEKENDIIIRFNNVIDKINNLLSLSIDDKYILDDINEIFINLIINLKDFNNSIYKKIEKENSEILNK